MSLVNLRTDEVHVWLAQNRASPDVLRNILGRYTASAPEFDRGPHGKPYLRNEPRIRFNLSHSGEVLLVAVALDAEVGVDVERLRPMPDCLGVAERFFAPGEAAALAEVPAGEREREFFVRWTRTEAMLKARGVGLYGAGTVLGGDWTVVSIDVGQDYAAAVAAERSGMRIVMRSGSEGAG